MIYYSDDETQCTCGAEGRAHKKACPLNLHLLYQAKPGASTPVRPPNSTPFTDRKGSSLKVTPFPTAKTSKLSTPCRVREYWQNPSVKTLLLPKRTCTAFAEEEMKKIWWNVMDVIARFIGFTLSVWGSLKLPKVNGTAMTVHKSSISMTCVSIQLLYVLQIRPLLMTGNEAVLKYPRLPQPRRANSQLCSTTQSARVLAKSFSPNSSSPEEDLYCICRGRDEGNMVVSL